MRRSLIVRGAIGAPCRLELPAHVAFAAFAVRPRIYCRHCPYLSDFRKRARLPGRPSMYDGTTFPSSCTITFARGAIFPAHYASIL